MSLLDPKNLAVEGDILIIADQELRELPPRLPDQASFSFLSVVVFISLGRPM